MSQTERKPKPPGVFSLQLKIRDAQNTQGSDRILLAALGLRARFSAKSGNFYCFPAYATLAADTQLNARTLKRAAQRLEAAGIVRRIIRPNRSNFYFINYALLAEAADEAKRVASLTDLEDLDAFAQEEFTSSEEYDDEDDLDE